jgi:hypothetical protein
MMKHEGLKLREEHLEHGSLVTDARELGRLCRAAELARRIYGVKPCLEVQEEERINAGSTAAGQKDAPHCSIYQKVLHEGLHMHHVVAQSSFLMPAYMIQIDHQEKQVVWVLRGTSKDQGERIGTDVLMDACAVSTPIADKEGTAGHAHWAMYKAAEVMLGEHFSR